MAKTYYELFDIKETASPEEISEAYHKLIFKYHPDRNLGNKKYEEITKKIIFIHGQLTDPVKRFVYDKEIAEAKLKDSPKYEGNTDKLWEEEINNEVHYVNHYPNPPKQDGKRNQNKSYHEPESAEESSYQEADSGKYDYSTQPGSNNTTKDSVEQVPDTNAPPNQVFAKVLSAILLIGIILYSYLISQKF